MKINSAARALAILCLGLTVGLTQAATITWTINITPKGGGTVIWKTDSPSASGQLTASGKITFNEGAYVDLTFSASMEHTLVAVFKGGDDWTPYLDASYHFQFGPVSDAYAFKVIFSGGSGTTVVAPTGLFTFSFPTGSTTLTSIMDVTGNYTGVGLGNRAYNVDVVQDEFGKMTGMGAVQGLATSDGSPYSATFGAVKTVNNQPLASGKQNLKGTQDGAPATLAVSGTSNLVPQTVSSSTILPVTANYKQDVNGVKKDGTSSSVQVPVNATQTATNMKKAWNIMINIAQMTIGTKTALGAAAVLTLPNGDQIYYAPRAVKYSTKNGYSLSFKSGLNITVIPAAKDKGSSVTIKNMTLTQSGTTWTVTGGTMMYKFMGQKGQGDLLGFMH